jgi:8-amino-7-oxononanoate synthase
VPDLRLALEELQRAGLHRELREIESMQGPRVRLDGREVILLGSNDYLGLAGDPRVADAAAEYARRGRGRACTRTATWTPRAGPT